MPKHIEIADAYGAMQVTGPALSRSGHKYLAISCTHCGARNEVRLAQLRKGDYTCGCGATAAQSLSTVTGRVAAPAARTVAPFPSINGPLDFSKAFPDRINDIKAALDTLRESNEALAAGQQALQDTLGDLRVEIADMRAYIEACNKVGLSAPAVAIQAAALSQTLIGAKPAPPPAPPRTITRASLLVGLPQDEHTAALRASSLRARELAELKRHERTPELLEELRERWMIDLDRLDRDPLNEQLAAANVKLVRAIQQWDSRPDREEAEPGPSTALGD